MFATARYTSCKTRPNFKCLTDTKRQTLVNSPKKRLYKTLKPGSLMLPIHAAFVKTWLPDNSYYMVAGCKKRGLLLQDESCANGPYMLLDPYCRDLDHVAGEVHAKLVTRSSLIIPTQSQTCGDQNLEAQPEKPAEPIDPNQNWVVHVDETKCKDYSMPLLHPGMGLVVPRRESIDNFDPNRWMLPTRIWVAFVIVRFSPDLNTFVVCPHHEQPPLSL